MLTSARRLDVFYVQALQWLLILDKIIDVVHPTQEEERSNEELVRFYDNTRLALRQHKFDLISACHQLPTYSFVPLMTVPITFPIHSVCTHSFHMRYYLDSHGVYVTTQKLLVTFIVDFKLFRIHSDSICETCYARFLGREAWSKRVRVYYGPHIHAEVLVQECNVCTLKLEQE